MSAYTGRDVIVEFAIGNETDSVGSLTFKVLGMCRGKSLKATWDTVDATADKSPQFTKQSLVSFKDAELSLDGVTYTDAIHNQRELKAHVLNPGSATGNQPKAWFRLTGPDGVTTGPFIVSEWSDDMPHADVATWQTSAKSNGAVVFVPA